MTNSLEDVVNRMVASMDDKKDKQEQDVQGTTDLEPQQDETIHIHYFPDAIVILKEGEETPQPHTVVETTLAPTKKPPVFIVYAICTFYLFLVLSCIAFQVYEILNPPLATVTIMPKSQTITLTGTLQLGRLLNPLTVSQSQTVPATGTGHQDAQAATGTLTFYNGQQTAQTVVLGTVFTGRSGVSIETTQSATIPPGNPSRGYGIVTVTAQAVVAGSNGNIQAGDVNIPIALAVFVKSSQFTRGQDERDFSTVRQEDIHTVSTAEIPRLRQEMQGALQGQLLPLEQLQLLPCTPTVTSDHHIGQEATTVTVSVSETCSAVAYTNQELVNKATDFLTRHAEPAVKTGYRLLGDVQVHITQATTTHTITPLVFLSFQAQGTWVYALTHSAQQQIKTLIAGKTKPVARAELLSMPGVAQAAIAWGDDSKLPTDTRYIHIVFVIG